MDGRLAAAKEKPTRPDKKTLIEKVVKHYKETLETLTGECREPLRDILRALGVRLVFDPERKEGWLRFDPFGQSAKRQQPPAA